MRNAIRSVESNYNKGSFHHKFNEYFSLNFLDTVLFWFSSHFHDLPGAPIPLLRALPSDLPRAAFDINTFVEHEFSGVTNRTKENKDSQKCHYQANFISAEGHVARRSKHTNQVVHAVFIPDMPWSLCPGPLMGV